MIVKKRKKPDDDATQSVASYVRMLQKKGSLGRMCGDIQGLPKCHFVRAIEKGGLKKNEYLHVYTCKGQYMVCECDAMERARRVVTMTHENSDGLDKLVETSHCIHVKAVDLMLSKKIFDTSPVTEYGPITVLKDDAVSIACDETPFSRVVVTIDRKKNKYTCTASACKYTKQSCKHIKFMTDYVVQQRLSDDAFFLPFDDPLPENEDRTPHKEDASKGCKCISYQKISTEYMEPCSRQRMDPRNPPRTWLPSGTNCIPSADGLCPQCSAPWAHSTLAIKEIQATLYGSYEAIDVTVYERHCACGCLKPYDGKSDGVFNYSNKTLWLHETMMAYVDLMIEARMPFNAYYEVLQRQYQRRSASTFCSKKTFIHSLEAFLTMLDIDYDHCFTCPVCSALPMSEQVYIIDGKAMGFQRKLAKTDAKKEETQGEAQAQTIPGTTFAYIGGSKDAQKLARSLRTFASRGATPMEKSVYRKMIRSAKQYAEELVPVLEYLWDAYGNTSTEEIKCPDQFANFIYDIATPCPISCLIPRSLTRVSGSVTTCLLAQILEKEVLEAEDMNQLLQWHSFAKAMSNMRRVPEQFHALLHELIRLAQLPEHYVEDAPTATSISVNMPDTDPMKFFPNHPIVRKRRQYDEKDDGIGPTCTKNPNKSHTFTPGVFTVFCPHGIAIGFEAMREFEGARIPFDLFYTRFPVAPGTIIYDNACNASRYCLRREPLFFSKVRWLIDRLHQLNHCGCHSGYNMNAHPQTTKLLGGFLELGKLNSQAAEQRHAKMKLIETQTSFMGEETFLHYTKLFLALTNLEILKQLEQINNQTT